MTKQLISLGLMSGTSGDGVDASIIQSDGEAEYKALYDNYFEYSQEIYEKIHELKEKINNSEQISLFKSEVDNLEKKITLFHAEVVSFVIKESKQSIDLVGFHKSFYTRWRLNFALLTVCTPF